MKEKCRSGSRGWGVTRGGTSIPGRRSRLSQKEKLRHQGVGMCSRGEVLK